jgi:adenylate kinase
MMNLAKRTSFSFTEALKTKKFFLLFGAPGVGKGPFARLLQKDLKMFHLSPSTEIRSIIRGGNSGGIEIQLIEKLRKVVKSGGLITDDLMMELIKEKLNLPEAENGLLLDGYPKTEHQLNHFFQSFSISGALNIVLREDVLLQRIKSRRACVPCRKTFYLE